MVMDIFSDTADPAVDLAAGWSKASYYPAYTLNKNLDGYGYCLESSGEPITVAEISMMSAEAQTRTSAYADAVNVAMSKKYADKLSPVVTDRIYQYAVTDTHNSIGEFDSLDETDSEWWEILITNYVSLVDLVQLGIDTYDGS